MKKLAFLLALLTVVTLTACGQKSELEVQEELPKKTEQIETQQPEDETADAAAAARAAQTELTFYVEGQAETVSATLYIGQGYSVYIPDEGWLLEQDEEDGVFEECWESAVNDDVKLRVLRCQKMNLQSAQNWVITEEDDFDLIEDKRGGLGGTDREDQNMLEARFYPSEDQMYIVLYEFPLEATEGFGARLEQIVETFVLAE